MKRVPLLALTCLMFCSAAGPVGAADAVNHPLAGNDHLLPPHSVAESDGLISLYTNPAGLAMRPGEFGLLYFQGLRGGTDDPALEGEFDKSFTGEWSVVTGGGLAFGLDRADGLAGYHYTIGGVDPVISDPRYNRYWRMNIGYGKRIEIPAWQMQLGLGFAYRWTSSSAYALNHLQSWDLGAMVRWGRWASVGFSARNLNRPSLKGLSPGDIGEVAPNYRFSLALRPRVDWATVGIDILQTEAGDVYEYESEYTLRLSPYGRFDLSLGLSGESRYSLGVYFSLGGIRTGGNMGNRYSADEGTSRGSMSVELRNRHYGKSILKNRHYLEIALAGNIPEAPAAGGLLGSPDELCTRDILDLIRRARFEPDVAGIYLTIDSPEIGLAQLEEIRRALEGYRRVTGKPIVAYAPRFDTRSYYLATAASSIVLDPAGDVWLTGMSLNQPFFKNALDKLGIEAQFSRHGRYKSGMESLTSDRMSGDAREADSTVLRNRFSAMKRDISEGRRIDILSLDSLIDRSYFEPEHAVQANLVDAVLYADQVPEFLKEQGGSEATLDVDELEKRRYTRRNWRTDPRVALIYLTGSIVRGESGSGIMGRQTGAASIAAALGEARRDPSIVGVILRVDSGGGGGLASELILREIQITALEKPVIVSMGNAGASGAYLVSIEATRILADRHTITGSIGVFGGKFYIAGLMDKLGISVQGVSAGKHARVNSPLHPYTEEEWEQLQTRLDRFYFKFVQRVAAKRRISWQEVDLISRGRIWTGEDAISHGLIDGIGGLEEAMRSVRRAASIDPGSEIEVVELPRRRSLLSQLLAQKPRTSVLGGSAEDLADWLGGFDPFSGESVLYYEPRATSLPMLLSPEGHH